MSRPRHRISFRLGAVAIGIVVLVAQRGRADTTTDILTGTAVSEPATAWDPKLFVDSPSHDAAGSRLENFSLFGGLEASRQPQDLGINANFGGNLSGNLGIPLVREWGLGAQIGMGVNLSKAGVKVLRVVEGTRDRTQWFTTVGLFRKAEGCYGAVAYDFLVSNYYSPIQAGQVRGEIGASVDEQNILGFWGTLAATGDHATILDERFKIRPISQVNLFWNHKWQTGAETRLWLGIAGQHGTDIVLIRDTHRSDPAITFGLQVFVPLNDRFALFGQGNFVTPSDTGTLDAYLGFAYFFGGSREHRTNRFAPVLPVANNPTFALDLRSP